MTTPLNRYYLRSLPEETDTETSDGEEQSQNCSLEDSVNLSDISTGTDLEDTVQEVVNITEPQPVLINAEEASIGMANHIRPATFAGDAGCRADVWLKEYESFVRLTRIPEENKALYLQFYLDGKAKKWYQALPDTTKQNYDVLVEELKRRFNGDDGLGHGFGLWALNMLPGESAEDYISRVNSFNMGGNVPENILVGAAMKGLSVDLQRIVMPQRITTLDELRVAVLLAERTLMNTGASVNVAKVRAPEYDSLSVQVQKLADELRDLKSQMVNTDQPQPRSAPMTYSRQRGQYRNQQMQANQRSNGQQTYACRNCRGMVSHSLKHCPAYNQKCSYCGLLHHTELVCEKKERELNTQGRQ